MTPINIPLLAGFYVYRKSWVWFVIVPLGWYLIFLSGNDFPSQQWIWIELLIIPGLVLGSTDALVGRFERGELETFLVRASPRALFIGLTIPLLILSIAICVLVSLAIGYGAALEATSRLVQAFGFFHLVLSIVRSRWFAVVCVLVWWFVGFAYMTAWAETSPLVAIWHPMRLSGGGGGDTGIELIVLATGAILYLLAVLFAGKENRWLK